MFALWYVSNAIILDPFCSSALIMLVLFRKILLIIEFTKRNAPPISLLSSIFCISYQFNFFFHSQNLSFIIDSSHVITLLSPVNCRGRKAERNIKHSHYYRCIFQAWNLCSCLKWESACTLKDKEMFEFSK